jgi:hypothetical protein
MTAIRVEILFLLKIQGIIDVIKLWPIHVPAAAVIHE